VANQIRSPGAADTVRPTSGSTTLSAIARSGGLSRHTTVALSRSATTSTVPSACGSTSRGVVPTRSVQGRLSDGVRRATAPPLTP
jgi:hypothetical protein